MAEFRSSRGMLMSMEIAMVAASEEDCDQNFLCRLLDIWFTQGDVIGEDPLVSV